VFRYVRPAQLGAALIEHGAVKIFTVASGTVRVCYDSGQVKIFEAGRYGVFSPNFKVGPEITTRQQNLKFDKHQVLLEGGINFLVEGLLTYQVVDVGKLITQLGDSALEKALQNTLKAELARLFAGVFLEQISAQATDGSETKEANYLGGEKKGADVNIRSFICSRIVKDISPLTAGWGVKLINFQLESTRIADPRYATEYEEASLAMAKAKANRRAVTAQNDILIQRAEAKARAVQIQAEGTKIAYIKGAQGRADSALVEATASAKARVVEAASRNDAAKQMSEPFGRQLAFMDRNVQIAASTNASTVVISSDPGIARSMLMPPR